jgi:phosphoribosylformylglycinamidine (FGAM) synthase-like enzyme
MAIAGRLGMTIDRLPDSDTVSALFSESSSRFVCELAADDVEWLAAQLGEPVVVLGTVTADPTFVIAGSTIPLDDLVAAFGARS